MSSSPPTTTATSSSSSSFDEEWEEWDGTTPFWHHCVAGSLAGVAEHILVYPLDTVRTHIQACGACQVNTAGDSASRMASNFTSPKPSTLGTTTPYSLLHKGIKTSSSSSALQTSNFGMWQTIRHLVNQPAISVGATTGDVAAAATAAEAAGTQALSPYQQIVGVKRLWRGVQTIFIGCIPAHALYFSTYEIVKASTLDPTTHKPTTYGSALAGASAVFMHDVILAPLDTVKQRLQLGHYRGLSHAMQTMISNEGWVSLYRSFPITLATNVPYGMVMVGTNEFLKEKWSTDGTPLTLSTMLGASSVAGFIASAITTPLDRVKTFLQTQRLVPACDITATTTPDHCPLKLTKSNAVVVHNWQQAVTRIYQYEGLMGFFRGMLPRVLSHTPAVAISWTSYETAKQYLLAMHHQR